MFEKIYKWSKHKIRELSGPDIKCPNCNEWFAVTAVDHTHRFDTLLDGEVLKATCGQCKHDSFWNLDIAPVAIRCNEKGIPVQI